MFAHVIPLRRTPLNLPYFDYLVPPKLESTIAPGQLVEIPFRTHTEYGIVKELATTSAHKVGLKSLASIVTLTPFISPEHLAFLTELAELYHAPLGFVVKSNIPELPKKLTLESPKPTQRKNNFNKPKLQTYANNTDRGEQLQKLFANTAAQILILVPEIEDIHTIENSLTDAQKKETTLVYSTLTPKEYRTTWLDVWNGTKKIIIGTRQALFLSFHNLEHIVIDNEGHSSHKSWDMAPRFHTRDAGLMLARHEGAHYTILTHTPTVESYYFATKNIYETSGSPLPKQPPLTYHIVDTSHERQGKNFHRLSNTVKEFLEKDTGTIFLFLNKLGTAGYSCCRDCGLVFSCKNCKRTYNYSEKKKTLRCNWCKLEEPVPLNCPKCESTNIYMSGAGTEQIEKDLKARFPDRPILRIDSANATTKVVTIPPGAIIIGTQHAWTRIPWNTLRAMVFVEADAPLFSPEYKSTENLWQQLHDAAAKLPTSAELFIQTKHVEHSIFKGFAMPATWYNNEISNRKLFKYPPHNFIIKLFSSAASGAKIQAEAQHLYTTLFQLTKTHPDITITPNLEMFPHFLRGSFWQVIIIKVSYRNYKQMTREIMRLIPEKWKVDLNPSTLLTL